MRRVLPLLLAAGAAPSPEERRAQPSPAHVTATCSNRTDCTAELQAALDSGARAVLVPYLGRPWPITPISLRSNQVVSLAPNVELGAKRGAFQSKDARMIVAHGVQNVGLEGGPGSVIRMRQDDYLNRTAGVRYSWSWDRHGIDISNVQGMHIRGLTVSQTGGNVVSIANER